MLALFTFWVWLSLGEKWVFWLLLKNRACFRYGLGTTCSPSLQSPTVFSSSIVMCCSGRNSECRMHVSALPCVCNSTATFRGQICHPVTRKGNPLCKRWLCSPLLFLLIRSSCFFNWAFHEGGNSQSQRYGFLSYKLCPIWVSTHNSAHRQDSGRNLVS